jgi:hypothetical protein
VDDFWALAQLGRQLAEVHLLRDPVTQDVTRRPTNPAADARVIKPTYIAAEERIYFNDVARAKGAESDTFWMGNVSPAAWAFEMGNIAQVYHWLKERRYKTIHRPLGEGEVPALATIINAIEDTFPLQVTIDELFCANEQAWRANTYEL